MSEDPKNTPQEQLTKEESAFFIRAFWGALLAPKWPRSLLIDLGKLVHAKTPLAKFDEIQLGTFLPYLTVLAKHFGDTLAKQTRRTTELDKTEIAFLIRTLWEALISPDWKSDDLIELGKCVYAKTTFASLPDRQFTLLFPYVTEISNKVGTSMLQSAGTAPPAPPATPPAPSNTPAPPAVTASTEPATDLNKTPAEETHG